MTAPTPPNWSMLAIPESFLLGMVPHAYYVTRLMIAARGQISYAMPRTNLEALKGKLSTEVWNSLARARGAHLNSMEVFPLFAAAVIAGNTANLPAKDMNNMALSFLGLRVLYLGLYMGVKNNTLAWARTGVYYWGIGVPLVGLWHAGQAWRAE